MTQQVLSPKEKVSTTTSTKKVSGTSANQSGGPNKSLRGLGAALFLLLMIFGPTISKKYFTNNSSASLDEQEEVIRKAQGYELLTLKELNVLKSLAETGDTKAQKLLNKVAWRTEKGINESGEYPSMSGKFLLIKKDGEFKLLFGRGLSYAEPFFHKHLLGIGTYGQIDQDDLFEQGIEVLGGGVFEFHYFVKNSIYIYGRSSDFGGTEGYHNEITDILKNKFVDWQVKFDEPEMYDYF